MSWQVDYAHTTIQFSVRHMMIATVRGEFEKFKIETALDDPQIEKLHAHNALTEQDFLDSHLTVEIDAASINTRVTDRDNHLRSPDFLNVAQYPTITFKATRGEKIDETHGKLYGDLTIRDVTKPVVLNVEYVGEAKSPWGTRNVGFAATTKINRKDWNLNWNVALETGGWLVGDEIKVEIDIEFMQVPQPQPATPETAAA
jgi:polyisoprenoid-binding protein YceI